MPCALFGPVWPGLAPFGPGWPKLALVGPIWPRLALFGLVWPCLTSFGPIWPILGLFGSIYPYLAPFGPIELASTRGKYGFGKYCMVYDCFVWSDMVLYGMEMFYSFGSFKAMYSLEWCFMVM